MICTFTTRGFNSARPSEPPYITRIEDSSAGLGHRKVWPGSLAPMDLHDPKHTDTAPRAWPEKKRLYVEINRAAGQRLAKLGADAAAHDASRVTRVPGSVHSGSHQRVKYWIQAAAGGQAITYTLDALARAFGVDPQIDSAIQWALFRGVLATRQPPARPSSTERPSPARV